MADLTTELLKQIRDGVHALGERVGETNARLDQTNARLDRTRTDLLEKIDQTRTELGERIDQTRTELGERIDQTRTELGERIDQTNARLGHFEGSVGELVVHVVTIAERGNRFADDLADLRRRVEVLEARTRG